MRKLMMIGIVALAAASGVARPAEAQRARVVFTPFVGGYVPLSELGSVGVNIGGQDVTASAKMKAAPTFGARFGYYPRGRFGIEGSYFFAPSKSRIDASVGGFSVFRDQDGQVQGGSLKAAYRLTDGRTDTDFFVSGGISGTSHGGDLFDATGAQDQFDLGGVLGFGLHIAMSPQVTFRVDGDLSLYQWSQYRVLSSKTQADFLLTAGLGLRLGR